MWNGIPTRTIQIQPTPHLPTTIAISASARRTNSSTASNQVNLKDLGQAVLNLTSQKLNPNSKPIQNDEEMAVDGDQLSGSDILLALQRADLRKKNKKKSGEVARKSKRSGNFFGQNDSDDDFEGSSEVRPLMIKSEWGQRIVDLEKRLQEVSDI